MAKTLRIGLTGCIGSGKSVVARIFNTLGVPIFNADRVAHALMMEDPTIKARVQDLLGGAVYDDEGTINKQILAQKIFVAVEKKKALEALIHPAVLEATELWFVQQVAPYAIKESALLGQVRQHWDGIIKVEAREALCMDRVRLRSPHLDGEVLQHIFQEQQQDLHNLSADYVLYNNEEDTLLAQVWTLHTRFIENSLVK